MSVHEVRARLQQGQARSNNAVFWAALALIATPPLGYGVWKAATSMRAASIEASSAPSAAHAARASDPALPKEARVVKDWVMFNRGAKPGDSAEDFVYANCMLATGQSNYVKRRHGKEFDAIEAKIKAAPDEESRAAWRSKLERTKTKAYADAEQSCRDSAKGYTWEKN